MSNQTNELKKQKKILSLISLGLNVIPMLIFLVLSLKTGDNSQRLTITLLGIAAIILTILMALFKFKLSRTLFWLLLLGIYLVYDRLGTCFVTIGICSVADEVIVSPLLNNIKEKYTINKEIDKRC